MTDAPKPPIPTPGEWATYIASRRPQHKIHKTRGQAVSAIYYQVWSFPRGGTIFQFIDGEWVEVFSFKSSDAECYLCGEKFGYDEVNGLRDRQYMYNRGMKKGTFEKLWYHSECNKQLLELEGQKRSFT